MGDVAAGPEDPPGTGHQAVIGKVFHDAVRERGPAHGVDRGRRSQSTVRLPRYTSRTSRQCRSTASTVDSTLAVGHNAFVPGNTGQPEAGRAMDQLRETQGIGEAPGSGASARCSDVDQHLKGDGRSGEDPGRRVDTGSRIDEAADFPPGIFLQPGAEAHQAVPVDHLVGDENVPVSPAQRRRDLVHGGDSDADGAGSHLARDDRRGHRCLDMRGKVHAPLPAPGGHHPDVVFEGIDIEPQLWIRRGGEAPAAASVSGPLWRWIGLLTGLLCHGALPAGPAGHTSRRPLTHCVQPAAREDNGTGNQQPCGRKGDRMQTAAAHHGGGASAHHRLRTLRL